MKKLIEVALPLEAINAESAREKSIRHGHPSTLHLWWARRPLAACRAVLFASLVDDPGEYIADEDKAHEERQRMFRIIEELVLWENSNNEDVLDKARLEIARSVARNLGVQPPIGPAAVREFLAEKAPPVLDPFAGGGSIPLEAQRLGLRAYASDLNPVAVLINKALIEIPPRFAGRPPVHPPETFAEGQKTKSQKRGAKAKGAQLAFPTEWKGAAGLAEDVRYYGQWMRDEAEKRIGHLYPKVKLPPEYGSGEATVIVWLWARTVKCPNPACGATMPLVRSFMLSAKNGKQAWAEPVIDRSDQPPQIRFVVKTGSGIPPEGTVNRRGARCIACDTSVPFDYIRAEGKAKRMSAELIALIGEGKREHVYVSPSEEHLRVIAKARPSWIPDVEMPYNPFSVRPPLYGFRTFAELFTSRQLVALATFGNLLKELREIVRKDAEAAGMQNNPLALNEGGLGSQAYADAIATYMAFAIDRGANYWSTLTPWGGGFIVQTFGRQALPMIWDYAEGNPFSESTGNWSGAIEWIAACLTTSVPAIGGGSATQMNAVVVNPNGARSIICTDPLYYDNVDYADLSDYFYVWLRHSIGDIFPDLCSTLLVPKKEELVATPYRFDGNRQQAQEFFENGLGQVFTHLRDIQVENYPLTVFYAFKQAESYESDNDSDSSDNLVTSSTGWETMLEGLLRSGLSITGTWPLRTERDQGLKSRMNVLASSIVLVCRPRPEDASLATRRDFLAELKKELPPALRELQRDNIAPVDLAQAAIGPGMAVFSRYRQVLEADGSPMRVRAALALINQAMDEFLTEQEGEYDADTRWALAWFEQYGQESGPYGVAETLSKAKNTSPEGLVRAGILESRAGQVHLLRREELRADWDPRTDERPTAWEAAQYLIRALDQGGEQAASALLAQLGASSENARDLAYRLYTICERKSWAQEALGYNMLVVAWPRLVEMAAQQPHLQSILPL